MDTIFSPSNQANLTIYPGTSYLPELNDDQIIQLCEAILQARKNGDIIEDINTLVPDIDLRNSLISPDEILMAHNLRATFNEKHRKEQESYERGIQMRQKVCNEVFRFRNWITTLLITGGVFLTYKSPDIAQKWDSHRETVKERMKKTQEAVDLERKNEEPFLAKKNEVCVEVFGFGIREYSDSGICDILLSEFSPDYFIDRLTAGDNNKPSREIKKRFLKYIWGTEVYKKRGTVDDYINELSEQKLRSLLPTTQAVEADKK